MYRKSLRKWVGVLTLTAVLLSVVAGVLAVTANAEEPPLKIDAKSAILIDSNTGQVLFEQNADAVIPPASLTKIMTLHLAYQRLAEGGMKLEDKVHITEAAWAAKMPGSSVMWLEPGQTVTVGEIMKGIAIPSGNDASVALAQHMAGTVDAFVAQMNKEARDMGYKTMQFADPAGLSPQNKVTAREYADFARRYIMAHPQALADLHSVKEYTYPKTANLPPDKTPQDSPPVTQYNRNGLLWDYEGADGLKTGFIDESGYNLAATAKRGDMRLIAVVLGAPGSNDQEGSMNRNNAAMAMLNWGFAHYVPVKPEDPGIKPVRVWKGAKKEVALETDRPLVLTVPRGQEGSLVATVKQETSTIAPVKQGDKLGEVIYSADGKEVAKFQLLAAEDVEQGGFFRRLWDSIRLTIAGWFKKK